MAEVCLDWFHVVERLWEAGQVFHQQGTSELNECVGKQTAALREGRVSAVLDTLRGGLTTIPKTGPGNKGRRTRLEAQLRFLENHQKRLRYAELRADDLVIGSGVIEGAVRNLIRMRLDGPGMRWGRQRSERVLHLPQFAAHLARLTQLRLPSEPARAQTHDAKVAA